MLRIVSNCNRQYDEKLISLFCIIAVIPWLHDHHVLLEHSSWVFFCSFSSYEFRDFIYLLHVYVYFRLCSIQLNSIPELFIIRFDIHERIRNGTIKMFHEYECSSEMLVIGAMWILIYFNLYTTQFALIITSQDQNTARISHFQF